MPIRGADCLPFDTLACRIVAAVAEAGYRISPVEVTEDTHSHRGQNRRNS
jgi:hypothetical protein